MQQISRRKFVALTASGLATAPMALKAGAVSSPVTAQQVVDRIKKNIGVDWKADTTDTFKAGDPSTAVTGIVTTSLASLDVLNQAIKAGANMIVTCEPTFYSKADTSTPPARRFPGRPPGPNDPPPPPPPPPAPDAVFSGKDAFLKKHNLVVFRLKDHWQMRTPDPFAKGLGNALGWAKFADAGDAKVFSIPETSLDMLASYVKRSLKVRGGMRMVGDPRMRIRKVAVLPGSTPIQDALKTLPAVDVIIAGEMREWEGVEYVRDTVDLGGKKSLALVGRIVSEDPGMQVCAQWLKTIVPEVASTWISAGDPYWRPVA